MNLVQGISFKKTNITVSTDIEGSSEEYDVQGARVGDSVLMNVIGQDSRLRFEASVENNDKIKVKYHFNRDDDQQQDNITNTGLTLLGVVFFSDERS